nr:MAG TPA: hypothetical protein [Caudoviricetes sp.]
MPGLVCIRCYIRFQCGTAGCHNSVSTRYHRTQ